MKLKLQGKLKLSDLFLLIFAILSILGIIFDSDISAWISSLEATGNKFADGIIARLEEIVTSAEIVILAAFVLRLITLFSALGFKRNAKMLTIMSMLTSILKWIVIFIIVMLILSLLGVDTKTLLASAGILTLVIGLGAQSLIADILAGFFLVFEGGYEVGDIVTIDGWRGTVQDIGIRVTRLIDAGGNIKTINNSDVKNVINQTTNLSVAKVYMSIDYSESLERVEKVIADNLERIQNNVKGIVEIPVYKGVSELGTSSVNLLIVAKCKEEDIYQVQRDMTRELYLIFNENQINIPFNQIVISNRGKGRNQHE